MILFNARVYSQGYIQVDEASSISFQDTYEQYEENVGSMQHLVHPTVSTLECHLLLIPPSEENMVITTE